MKWLELEDGSFLNTIFAKELRVQENDDSIGNDTHQLIAISLKMHEEIAHCIFSGNETDCQAALKAIVAGAEA